MTKNALQEMKKKEVELVEGAERSRSVKAYVPRVDIYETDDAVHVIADMPGVDEKSVDITLEKNVLSIYGETNLNNPDNYSLAYAEYEMGDYERKFTLSDEIDRDKIEASVKDGVLRLVLPKAGPAKTRRIPVKAA